MTSRIVRREAPGADGLPGELPALLRRIYAARGVTSGQALDYRLARMAPAEGLAGLTAATALLERAIDEHWRILVVGDFDADGATGVAAAVRGLRALGARHLDFMVPDRFRYGYGLSPEIAGEAARHAPDLIVTVDNGITSHEGVRVARRAGSRVLITDHHLPGPDVPEADAIVNPNREGDGFPSKHLAGVGVIFYVLVGLRARLREHGAFDGRAEPNLAGLLDLVALGTVTDVVVLDHNNRLLVEQGLARIRAGRAHPGVTALLRAAGRDPGRAAASDLGFAVGPRLNAAGRLEDMGRGIRCLLADTSEEATALASELDGLNRDRRELEGRMKEEALAAVERMTAEAPEGDALPTGLCVYDADWHEGVIGLLAGRLKDRLHRPVAAFAPAGDGQLKGSVRSVAGVHARDVLGTIAAANPGLLERFGGHAGAAGLTLPREHYEAFAPAFDAEVRRWLSREELEGIVYSDGELEPAELRLETAERLRAAGPWGQGFPEPVFDGEFVVADRQVLSGGHLKLAVRPEHGSEPIEALVFGDDGAGLPEGTERVRLAYRLDVNEFRGRRKGQLIVEHLEPL